MKKYGPNVTKLINYFIAREVIPPGGGIPAAIEFFRDAKLRQIVLATAHLNAIKAINTVKEAPDNPYGNDDEIIAGALVEKIEERKRSQNHASNNR